MCSPLIFSPILVHADRLEKSEEEDEKIDLVPVPSQKDATYRVNSATVYSFYINFIFFHITCPKTHKQIISR